MKKRKEVYKQTYVKDAVEILPKAFAELLQEWEVVHVGVINAGKHDDGTEFQTVKITLKEIDKKVTPK